MNATLETKNKARVLEAFDTLFNRRDYAAAEKFWSPDYIQHSAHIRPGREGLFNCTVHPELQRFVAKRMGASTTEVESSHVPMLSKPNVVIDVIRAAAKSIGK